MATQNSFPTTSTAPDSDQGLYESLAKKELEIIKSLEGKIDKLPEIPIVKAYFLWKVKELKAQTTLAQGINPQTGQKIESLEERVKIFAEQQAEALKYELQSASDAVLVASGGQTGKFNEALKIFGRRGGEAELLENAPKFLRFVAGKLDDETLKKALIGSSQTLEELVKNPVAKTAMVNAVRNSGPWQKFTTEAQDEILQERILRVAEEKHATIENLSPPPTNILITLQPTLQKTERKVKRAWSKAQILIKDYASAGRVALPLIDKNSLRDTGFPIGEFQGPEIAAAVNLYSKGTKGRNLEQIIDKLSTLSNKDQRYLYRIAFVVAALEETYGGQSRNIFTAQGEPRVVIQPSYGPAPSPQSNQLVLQRDGFGFLRPVLETGVDLARNKAKNLVMGALRKGGKKLIEKGATIAAKAGISKAAAAAIGAAAGGPVGIIASAVLFVRDLAKKFSSWLQRGIRKLFGLGEGDPKRRNAIIFAALAGAFLLAGFLPGAIVAGGVALGYAAASAGGVAGIATAGQALIYGITTVVIPSVAIPTLLAIIGIPLVVAFILFIINTSAYLVPPGEFAGVGIVVSPYIKIEKVPVSSDANKCKKDPQNPSGLECENSELPITIEYTITVTASKGTLTNIKFEHVCAVVREGAKPTCTVPTPSAPALISPADNFVFTYSKTYNSSFTDSFVIDTFTVTADVDSEGVVSTTAAGSASIKIGNPPDECPSGWPVQREGGEPPIPIKQGPHTTVPDSTHETVEAIDISTTTGHVVKATHTGKVSVGNYGAYGDFVDVSSVCTTTAGSQVQITTRYSHLNTINVITGSSVTLGQTVGTSGSSGTSAPHLHYEFRPPPGPLKLVIPYVPVNIPVGCYNFDLDTSNDCNVWIN